MSEESENKPAETWEEFLTRSHVGKLAEELGLPKTFFAELGNHDDWSFIIKLHALIEAAITQLLTYHYQEKRLQDLFANIETSDKKKGKIAFLEAADLLGHHHIQFIIGLSELRNKYVHNVKYTTISLSDIVGKYDKNQLQSFVLRFSPIDAILLDMYKNPKKVKIVTEPPDIEGQKKRALENPKQYIWIGAFNFLTTLADMYGKSEYLQYEKAKKHLTEEDDNNDE